jgi:hypothetical protein
MLRFLDYYRAREVLETHGVTITDPASVEHFSQKAEAAGELEVAWACWLLGSLRCGGLWWKDMMERQARRLHRLHIERSIHVRA